MKKIEKAEFIEKCKKVGGLTGKYIDADAGDYLYEEIKDEDRADVLLAMKEIAYSGDWLNISTLNKRISQYKAKRLERDIITSRNTEKAEGREIPDDVKPILAELHKKFNMGSEPQKEDGDGFGF